MMPPTAPLRAALLAQLGGGIGVLLLVMLLSRLTRVDFSQAPLLLALLQGGLAAIISRKLQAPPWWVPIHLVFVPLAVLVQGAEIAPGWFLAGFVLLLLIFWRTDQSRVPLYLTNHQTAIVVSALLPSGPCRVLDIGCGDGGLLRQLALARPDGQFLGIEHAPLPWLLAKLRTLNRDNADVRLGDFWSESLADYDVVYAFLSPAPMPRLWARAQTGMKPQALLVSNSFDVPGVAPERTIDVKDRRQTRLFLYRPHDPTDKAGESAAFPAIPHPSDQE